MQAKGCLQNGETSQKVGGVFAKGGVLQKGGLCKKEGGFAKRGGSCKRGGSLQKEWVEKGVVFGKKGGSAKEGEFYKRGGFAKRGSQKGRSLQKKETFATQNQATLFRLGFLRVLHVGKKRTQRRELGLPPSKPQLGRGARGGVGCLLVSSLTRGLPGCSRSARRRRRVADGCAGCHPASAGGWAAASPRRCSAAPPR